MDEIVQEINFKIKYNLAKDIWEPCSKVPTIKQLRDITMGGLKECADTTTDLYKLLIVAITNIAPQKEYVVNAITSMVREINDVPDLLDILHKVKEATVNSSAIEHTDDGTHKCERDGCNANVLYWDEPFCYTHSPDEGSSFRNYDSRKGGWLQA